MFNLDLVEHSIQGEARVALAVDDERGGDETTDEHDSADRDDDNGPGREHRQHRHRSLLRTIREVVVARRH